MSNFYLQGYEPLFSSVRRYLLNSSLPQGSVMDEAKASPAENNISSRTTRTFLASARPDHMMGPFCCLDPVDVTRYVQHSANPFFHRSCLYIGVTALEQVGIRRKTVRKDV